MLFYEATLQLRSFRFCDEKDIQGHPLDEITHVSTCESPPISSLHCDTCAILLLHPKKWDKLNSLIVSITNQCPHIRYLKDVHILTLVDY